MVSDGNKTMTSENNVENKGKKVGRETKENNRKKIARENS